MTRIHGHVAAIEEHFNAIVDIFSRPSAALFHANADILPAFERACNLKALIDAAVAYAADRANAGDRVGSSRTVDYLIKTLGLSYTDAQNRLKLGHRHHGTIRTPEPGPVPGPEPDASAESEDPGVRAEEQTRREAEDKARREAEEAKRAAEAQRRAEQEARDRAREQSRKHRLSQRVLDTIDTELDHLSPSAQSERHRLHAEAVEYAVNHGLSDLRDWLRTRVHRANRSSRDPDAALRRRGLYIGAPDADGGARISGYITADLLARLEAGLAPALKPGHLLPEGAKEIRSLAQRRHDALAVILHNYAADKIAAGGTGTVVVSISAKDIDDMSDPDAEHRYPTNTNAMLTPAEVLRLGGTKYNFVVVHDPDTGLPLKTVKTGRLATVMHRMALLATYLVCTDPECTRPFCDCEIHHLIPWSHGGMTEIRNLAPLCRPHHGDNRDQRDGKGFRGHAEYDPDSGRVGWKPPPRPGDPDPAVRVNETQRQQYSGGAKVRRQPWPQRGTPPRAPAADQPTLFGDEDPGGA